MAEKRRNRGWERSSLREGRQAYQWRRRGRHDTVAGAAGAVVPVCGRPETRTGEWRRKKEGRRGVEEAGARRGRGVDGGRPPMHGVVGRPPRAGAVVADRAVPDGGTDTPTRPRFLSRGTDHKDGRAARPSATGFVTGGGAAARRGGLVAASGGSGGGGGSLAARASHAALLPLLALCSSHSSPLPAASSLAGLDVPASLSDARARARRTPRVGRPASGGQSGEGGGARELRPC